MSTHTGAYHAGKQCSCLYTRAILLGKCPKPLNDFREIGCAPAELILLFAEVLHKHWVEDLVIAKTFNGMYVQKAILASLAERRGTTYRLATPEEESVGIDGYVGNVPYSVKPDTYKTMGRLSETIAVKMIYYTKTKTGLTIEIED